MSVVLVSAGVAATISAGIAWLLCRAARESDDRAPVCSTCRATRVVVPGGECAACRHTAAQPRHTCLACPATVPCEGALCPMCLDAFHTQLDAYRARS